MDTRIMDLQADIVNLNKLTETLLAGQMRDADRNHAMTTRMVTLTEIARTNQECIKELSKQIEVLNEKILAQTSLVSTMEGRLAKLEKWKRRTKSRNNSQELLSYYPHPSPESSPLPRQCVVPLSSSMPISVDGYRIPPRERLNHPSGASW